MRTPVPKRRVGGRVPPINRGLASAKTHTHTHTHTHTQKTDRQTEARTDGGTDGRARSFFRPFGCGNSLGSFVVVVVVVVVFFYEPKRGPLISIMVAL